MEGIHTSMAKAGLIRSDSRWMGGVCAGLARKAGIDAGAARLLMVLLILLPGSQVIVYPLLWVIMPDEATARRLLELRGRGQGPDYPQDRLH